MTKLSERDLVPDPIQQFRRWLDEAVAAQLPEPTAMALATATLDGAPSVRTVLLKSVDAAGFVFYSNYESQKGQELLANPRAALAFFWQPLERQVRVTGSVVRLSAAESERYFRTRPVGSQLGAWASPQSRVIPDRQLLEAGVATLAREHAGGPVPLPPFWGGYRVRPRTIEFWQGQPDRLHDRFLYTLLDDATWRVDRLAP